MLVAKVLTGLAFVSPRSSELRFPPERADTGVREGRVRHCYNSVQGTTGGSEVYITYSNEQAYPAYVISYNGSGAAGFPPTGWFILLACHSIAAA